METVFYLLTHRVIKVINKLSDMARLLLLLLAGARYYYPHYTTAHAAAIVSEEWCLKRGFDPTNLSCDTCALIDDSITLQRLQKETNDAVIQQRQKEGGETTTSSSSIEEEIIDISSDCRTCCKSYKVNPILRPGESLRGKYRYALLTYNEHSLGQQYSEIQDFINRDVNDIVSFKGESRFKAIPTSSSDGHHRGELDNNMMMMYGGLFGGGGGPPKLLLFGKQKKGGWSSEDEDEAEEVINLRGWKREDVKDMLMTLLPNA
jgi:hypothetical protein